MHNMEINIFLCQQCHFNSINSNYTGTPGHQNWTLVYTRYTSIHAMKTQEHRYSSTHLQPSAFTHAGEMVISTK